MTVTLLASSVAASDLLSKIFFLISTRILVSAQAPGRIARCSSDSIRTEWLGFSWTKALPPAGFVETRITHCSCASYSYRFTEESFMWGM